MASVDLHLRRAASPGRIRARPSHSGWLSNAVGRLSLDRGRPPDEATDLVHGHHRSIDPGQENKLAEAITLSDTGACVGCADTQARGLSGQAASAALLAGPGSNNPDNSDDPPSPKCNASPPAQEAVTKLSGSVVAFEDPPGVRGTGVPSGGVNPANGILTYSSGDTGTSSYLSTCTVPESDHSLCTAVLNDVLKRYWNF